MMDAYSQAIWALERAHHAFLGMMRLELERKQIREINNVQAMMLFYIGDEELTVGELTRRGCYLGSNVSYNVKKLVENGFLIQRRSNLDRRSVHVKLTSKGLSLRKQMNEMLDQQSQSLDVDLAPIIATMQRLDRFWGRLGQMGPSETFRNLTSGAAPGEAHQSHPR